MYLSAGVRGTLLRLLFQLRAGATAKTLFGMAEYDELKRMVTNFRVSELQVMLGYAGCSKSGRKQELLDRALKLVDSGCSHPVAAKIRDLYRQICATNQRRRFDGMPGIVAQEVPQQMINMGIAPMVIGTGFQFAGSVQSQHHDSFVHPFPLTNAEDGRLEEGSLDYNCKKLTPPVEPLASSVPVHPDVCLKPLAFYDVLGTLIKPTSLSMNWEDHLLPHNSKRMQNYQFHLTPEQAEKIARSRDCRPGSKFEYTVQLQLRFCLMETSCRQDDNLPPSVLVKVNGHPVQLPNIIPSTRQGVEPKRPGRPLDITRHCRLSPTHPNHLEVSWSSEFGRNYCLSLYLVRRLTTFDLLQRLKQYRMRHPDHTRALIKEKLAHDPESEVAMTSLRVSLICPLGKTRMTYACRSSTCSHLQCFDAQIFLLMNEKKPTWVCPVCDKPAPFSNLIIDRYYVDILGKSPESNDIVFHEDGSWTSAKQPKETHVIASPSTPIPVLLADSDSPSASGAAVSSTRQKGDKRDVVDLTMESTDEEEDGEETVMPNSDTPVAVKPEVSCALEAGSSGGCMSPTVINVDAPSPALSVHSVSASPVPSAVSHSQSPAPPAPVLAGSLSAHAFQSTSANMHSYFNPQSSSCVPLQSAAPTYSHPVMPPSAMQGNLGGAGRQLVNLETLSDVEFDDFLQSLTWKV